MTSYSIRGRIEQEKVCAYDGLALDWSAEQGAVWMCPPFALLPAIIQKLEEEKPAAVLIAPKWQMAPWWPNLVRLGGTHVQLPRPKHADSGLEKPGTTHFVRLA